MNRTRALFALGAMTCAAAATAGPAPALDAAKPTPCTGALHLTDPAGDQELDPFLPIGMTTSPENMDATGLFFNYRADKDGKKVLTANIQVANLDKTVPARTDSQGGIYYYVIYDLGGTIQFVAAHNTGSAIDYEYGTIDPDVGTYTNEGETVGQFFEGKDGIVQMDVPEAVGGKLGDKLAGALVTIDGIDIGTDHGNGINNHADSMPDEADVAAPDGKDYTTAECPAAGAAPTPTPTPAPTPAPGPSGGGGSAPAPTTLPVKFASTIGKASKARKGKKLTFAATASQQISGLTMALKKLGGKGATLASGKVATLKAGTSKVSIKVKKKGLKKGVYTLLATGTVNGKKLRVGQKVGLK